MGDRNGAYRVLVRSLRGRDHLDDRRRWKDDVKMDMWK